MKFFKKIFYILIAFGGNVFVHAQPVFTYSAFAPQIGDQYSAGHSGAYCMGSAGANQVWNFASVTIATTETHSVVAVSSIPCGAQFPNANMASGTGGGFLMLNISTSDYLSTGYTITPGMPGYIYSDDDKLFAFPMNYTNSFTDHYEGPEYNQPLYRMGDVTVTYEGYGTVITPIGTYANAICIHRHYTESDTSTSGGYSICDNDDYYWFAPGYRYPVVQSWTSGGPSCGLSSTGTLFLQTITIGQTELSLEDFSIGAFPNPFSNQLTIHATSGKQGDIFTISDLTGRVVRTFILTGEQMQLDLSDLEDGTYVIRMNDGRAMKIVKAGK